MLHRFTSDGKVFFFAENHREMELPGYLSMHTHSLGKLLNLGGVWWIDGKYQSLLTECSKTLGYRVCEECGAGPCVRLATHMNFWTHEYMRREQAAQERARRESERKQPLRGRPLPPPVPPLLGTGRRSREHDAALLLGVQLPCTASAIKSAFAKATLANHPDLGGSTERMIRIIEARDLLLASCRG